LPAPAKPAPDARIRLVEAFIEDAYLDTGVSTALMRRVARGEIPATVRLHRTGPILAFGRLDRLRPGYGRAVELAREHGYQPVERLAGGRAAVFHQGTISFSHAVRAGGGSGAYAGTRDRFSEMAATVARGLAALGLDSRVGEVEGEYCPGEFSVNARGTAKLAGIGQRVIVGGAHVGGVIVVRGAARIREVLTPIYEALEIEWEPATTGSVALELGADDETRPAGEHDSLIDSAIDAIRTELARSYELHPTDLDPATRRLAAELSSAHEPRLPVE
jgi:octanoyl-[GcvH]:protein N-octanoyltransferase